MLEIIRAVAKQLVFSIFFDYKYIAVYLFFYIVVRGRLEIIHGFEQCIPRCGDKKPRQILEELILVGLISGFFGGILTVTLGLYIDPAGLQAFLIIMAILAFINHRFVNPSYAGGILTLSALVLGSDKVHVPSMLSLIAVIQLTEAVLIYVTRKNDNIPIFIQHNGTMTGAFIKQKYFAVPFMMLSLSAIPNAVWQNQVRLGWGTMFQAGLSVAVAGTVFLMTGAIGVTNYSSISISSVPEEKCRNDAVKFLIGSLLLFVLAFLSVKTEVLRWVGSIFALFYRELVFQHGMRREKRNRPLYTAVQRGVRILEIIPGGTADKMKMKRGEIILNINGKPVQTEDGIRHVLANSPTFIWMHTEDPCGQIKIYEYKCYPDGVKDLDVILVPREWEITYQVDEYENFTIIRNIVDKFRFK